MGSLRIFDPLSNMKVLLLIFLLPVLNSYSQSAFGEKKINPNISPNTFGAYEPGIYTSLGNFLNFTPLLSGVQFDTLLKKIRMETNCVSSKKKDDTIVNNFLPEYPCIHTEANIKKLLLKEANLSIDSVWGFYDGRYAYYKFDGNFYPIVTWGTYSVINYYNNHRSNKMDNKWMRLLVIGIPPSNDVDDVFKETGSGVHIGKKERLILSLKTGEILPFNTSAILLILKEDAVLYNQYIKEKHDEENNAYYLFKFNEKHSWKF
ncbi:MAG: hypothetical protein JWN78_104 [Bacteroidota bacterium]|nr:hypothetical protein [Bacteroidota bacterium]